jgi:hypothetical protein
MSYIKDRLKNFLAQSAYYQKQQEEARRRPVMFAHKERMKAKRRKREDKEFLKKLMASEEGKDKIKMCEDLYKVHKEFFYMLEPEERDDEIKRLQRILIEREGNEKKTEEDGIEMLSLKMYDVESSYKVQKKEKPKINVESRNKEKKKKLRQQTIIQQPQEEEESSSDGLEAQLLLGNMGYSEVMEQKRAKAAKKQKEKIKAMESIEKEKLKKQQEMEEEAKRIAEKEKEERESKINKKQEEFRNNNMKRVEAYKQEVIQFRNEVKVPDIEGIKGRNISYGGNVGQKRKRSKDKIITDIVQKFCQM